MTRHSFRLTVLLLALAASGCDQGRTTPPDVRISVVHAAPSYSILDVLRGSGARSKVGVNLQYREAQPPTAIDADTYTFRITEGAPENSVGETLHSFTDTLSPDNAYHLVVAETNGALTPVLVEQPALASDGTNSAITLVHAAAAFGTVDVYVEPAGTALGSAVPLGTAAFLDNLPPTTRAAGEYRLFLTASGDPATVLFQSRPFTVAAGGSNLIVLTDGAGQGVAELIATRVAGGGVELLYDIDEQAEARFINAATDGAPRDIYVDDVFDAPLVGALAAGAASTSVTVAPGGREFNVTPAGNPSVVELDVPLSAVLGGRYTVLIAGDGNDLNAATALENRRSLRDTARLQIMNGAGLFDQPEFYLVDAGQNYSDSTPAALVAPSISSFSAVDPGDYELTIVDPVTEAVLAGPLAFTLEAGGFYSILALNAAGGSTIDLVLLDGFD